MSIPIHDILNDFRTSLPLAGVSDPVLWEVEEHGCPHIPRTLPRGKMAVYIFANGDHVLKVGKVGGKSGPRFRTQHYAPASSASNLAKSLLNDKDGGCYDVPAAEIGSWMRQNLHRIDILLSVELGKGVLAYLEAFLHCRLSPRYEGF